MVAHWAAAVLYNGLGRYEKAAAAAREVVANGILPWLSMWARCRAGRGRRRASATCELARDALDGLVATTQPAGSDFALGIEARSSGAPRRGRRCRGVVSRGDRSAGPDAGTGPSWPAHTCSSASGCAGEGRLARGARAAADGRGDVRRDRDGGVRRARAEGAGRRRREAAQRARPRRARSSRRRRSRSRGSPATASRTRRSAPSCSSVRAPSSGTCTGCSAKLGIDSRNGLCAALPQAGARMTLAGILADHDVVEVQRLLVVHSAGRGLWAGPASAHVLDGLLAKVRGGESEVLVIRGEAGDRQDRAAALHRTPGVRLPGRAAHRRARPRWSCRSPGVHQLCATMLDRLEALPAPQRDALSIALGLTSGEVPERFLVGLAVLSLLSAVAEERPLLCLVEDAQWLDAASSQVLGLVARRVRAESVAIVVAVREPDLTAGPRLRRSARASASKGCPRQDAGTRCWRAS